MCENNELVKKDHREYFEVATEQNVKQKYLFVGFLQFYYKWWTKIIFPYIGTNADRQNSLIFSQFIV